MEPLPPAPKRFRAHPGWHLIGGGLVAAWAVVLAAMFWPADELAATPLDAEDLDAVELAEEYWLGAYLNDRKLGYVHAELKPVAGGFALQQRTRLRLRVAGTAQPLESDLRVRLDRQHRLQRLELDLRTGPLELSASGRMRPEGLEITLDSGRQQRSRVLPVDSAPLFDLTLPRLLARQRLRAGDRYRVTVFDPQRLSNRPAVITVIGPEALSVGGRLVPAMHLRRDAGGVRVDSWIDGEGRLLKERLQGGLELVREEAERAKRGVTGAAGSEDLGLDPGLLRGLLGGNGAGNSEGEP
jgi:hypothetical protein